MASVDKAREIGLNWWENDSYYSSKARIQEKEQALLHERMNRLEHLIEGKALLMPEIQEPEVLGVTELVNDNKTSQTKQIKPSDK